MTYELRYDPDETGALWTGDHCPTQGEIDRLAKRLTARGWNGVQLDLYRDGKFERTMDPSDEALA